MAIPNGRRLQDMPAGRQPRPFGEWVAEANRLGFQLRVDHNPERFEVYAMLKPVTRKSRTALDRSLGDDCEMITCTTIYDKSSHDLVCLGLDVPDRDRELQFRISIDDTVAYALTMAQAALHDDGSTQ
jgi:hypothetical protein